MSVWLHIIGIGEDGLDGLSVEARAALEAAEVVIGGDRHHGLAPHLTAERVHWPSPFRAMLEEIDGYSGRQVAVLVTGDPLWFSAGAALKRRFQGAAKVYPQISSFQWAAARMGWSLADVETLTVHGRPVEQFLPYVAPFARILLLTEGPETPGEVARLLKEEGFGPSQMTILGALGGAHETRVDTEARHWEGTAPAFHVLAIECLPDEGLPGLPRWGLPDDVFESDGKMTKAEVRSVTLAALAPRRGALLWDIGCGCGSVAIEWMRAARDAQAIGLEPSGKHREMAARNARALGVPRLDLRNARAPDALADLPTPDAIFFGGGISGEAIETALDYLPSHGRLVANAVTLESETTLLDMHRLYGGGLSRIAVSRAEPVGRFTGWKPFMTVTQWSFSQ